MVLLTGHNIFFLFEVRKIIFELSSISALIWTSALYLIFSLKYALVVGDASSLSTLSTLATLTQSASPGLLGSGNYALKFQHN